MTKEWWVRCLLGNLSAHVFECQIRRAACKSCSEPLHLFKISDTRVSASEANALQVQSRVLAIDFSCLQKKHRARWCRGDTIQLWVLTSFECRTSWQEMPLLSQCYETSAFKTVMDIARSTTTYHSRPFPTLIQYCTSVVDTASFNPTNSIKRKGLCNRTLTTARIGEGEWKVRGNCHYEALF